MSEDVVVRYAAPHGEELLSLRDGDEAEFGRGGDCAIRFGFAPEVDRTVPRLAGRVVVRGGRAWIESCTEPGHRVLRIQPPDGPPVSLPHGSGQAPASDRFVVEIPGETSTYRVHVTRREPSDRVRPDGGTADGTIRHQIEMTPRQREVIAAYLAPLQRGRTEPASHADVASALGCGANNVRSMLYDVFETLFRAGVPMPEHSDKRVAVVEAVRLHGLLDGIDP